MSDNDIEHTWYSHTESFEAPNGESVTAEFFMLDTVRWAGLCNSDSSGFRRGRYWRQNMTERSLAQAVGGTRRYEKAYESCGGDKCCIYLWRTYQRLMDGMRPFTCGRKRVR